MDPSVVDAVKASVVAVTGLSKDALHVYVGLGVFVATALLPRTSIRSLVPWFAVLVVALLGEVVDAFDDLSQLGRWQWTASVHDVINTVAWPSILLLLARFTSMCGCPGHQA